MPATQPPAEAYRPDIDGLRAVSILAVVLYHARVPGFGVGYLGVDVFFVISGFLITGQLLREARSTGTIQVGMFYARRVRRLIPALVAMAFGTTVMALIYLHPMTEQRMFGNALSRSALFYYNIAAWRGGYAYDGQPAEQQVLMHTWSLGVEEQFYLIWPLICLLALRGGRPIAAFSMIVFASLMGSWWFLSRDLDAVFFLLPFRAWELGLGACVAASPRAAPSRAAGAGALIGLGLVMSSLASNESRPGLWAQVSVALGATLIAALGAAPNPGSAVLRAAPMVSLGRMSYAWYLWHWPLLAIGRLIQYPENPGIQPGALAAGFALAALTHVWIERPSRRIEIKAPIRMLSWGLGALASMVLLGTAIEFRSDRLITRPENAVVFARFGRSVSRPCETEIESLGCDLALKPADGAFLLLWGDSFARALAPALSEYSRDSGSAVRLLVEPACPPLLGAVPASRNAPGEPDPACWASLRNTRKKLQHDPGRLAGVILAGRWPSHVPGDAPERGHKMFDHNGLEIETSSATLAKGLGETLDFLELIGVRVLVVGAPPAFPFDVLACLWRVPGRCLIERSWEATARNEAQSAMESATRGRVRVRYVDLFDALCPGPRCSAGTLDEPLLADRTHLSTRAAQKRVRPLLVPYLDWLRGVELPTTPAALAR